MTGAYKDERRLTQILAKDKIKNPTRFSTLLKKETESFLKNFFDLQSNTLTISVTICQDGKFDFVIKGRANRLVPCSSI